MHAHIRFSPCRRQQGNTLIGIIVGLVIGLGIAVIVALAITKGALPFTDKAGKAAKPAEPTAGQASDPNKPLYGNKEPARAAARELASEAKAAEDDPLQQVIARLAPDPAPVPDRAPAARPAPVQVPAPAPAVKPERAPRVAMPDKSAPAVAAAEGEDKYIYYLQVGAFREMPDAENVRAKLALLGFEAAVTDRNSDTGVLHRVRMGPFNQVEAMNRTRSKLSENGIDVAVVRNQK